MARTRDLERLRAALASLATRVDGPAADWGARAPAISAWSVAQQVEHALRAAKGTLRAAASFAPEGAATPEARTTSARPTIAGRAVLWLGRIPRGKGRAPKHVLPDALPDAATSRALLREADQELIALAPRWGALGGWRGASPHPALGVLSADQWARFTRIHTEHHVALIEDILRARA